MHYLKYISKRRLGLFFFHKLKLFFRLYGNLVIFLTSESFNHKNSQGVFFYGLQRSGTNILKEIFIDHGLPILNFREYPHNSNLNRHFRFRTDSIPVAAVAKYFPRVEVLHPAAIVPMCFVKPNAHYIVVVRDFDEWIVSILRWGDVNSWFQNPEAKYRPVDALCIDYIKYCETWLYLKENADLNLRLFAFKSKSLSSDISEFLGMEVDLGLYENKRYRGSLYRDQDLRGDKKDEDKQELISQLDNVLYLRAKELFEEIQLKG